MDWDDQLESELKRIEVKGFRDGFAGRTMQALNRSIVTGTPYVSAGWQTYIGACFKKVSFTAAAILLALLFLNFGINFEGPGASNKNGIENSTSVSEDETIEEWLESVGDQLAAGLL